MKNNFNIYLLIIGIILFLIPEILADEPIIMEWEDHKGYELLTFDTAHGIFDPQIDSLQRIEYMKLWKKARKINFVLTNLHGSGSKEPYKYLKSEKILKSPYLRKYTIFLIMPGVRPCDYDENCEEVKDVNEVTNYMTKNIKYFPVIIDPKGQPIKEYAMSTYFNVMVKTEGIKIMNIFQAMELIQVYVFLSGIISKRTDDFITNFAICDEDSEGVYRINMEIQHGKLCSNFSYGESLDFEVHPDGKIREGNIRRLILR